MSAFVIDGKEQSLLVREQLREKIAANVSKRGRKPGLAVVLVGDNPASKVYVKSKTKNAIDCGMEVRDVALPGDVEQMHLENELRKLSTDPDVDGILLQLPLPKHLDEFSALLCITPKKDVDGLHPMNQGLLLRGEKTHQPCTPKGCMHLIDHARKSLGLDANLAGLNAVVLGRSILVGKPIALMLLERHCTLTVCHSRTKNLPEVCRQADILVAAVGKPEMVTADFVKKGAIVIDVGINRLESGKLVGDVNYAAVEPIASAITPVPGGVGPMTIAMLLSNTTDAWLA